MTRDDLTYRTGATENVFQSGQRFEPKPGRRVMRESTPERIEKASRHTAMEGGSIAVEVKLAQPSRSFSHSSSHLIEYSPLWTSGCWINS